MHSVKSTMATNSPSNISLLPPQQPPPQQQQQAPPTSLFSRLTFSYISSLMKLGATNKINESTGPAYLPSIDSAQSISSTFEYNYNKLLQQQKRNQDEEEEKHHQQHHHLSPSLSPASMLWLTLIRSHIYTFPLQCMWCTVEVACRLGAPIFLLNFLDFLQSNDTSSSSSTSPIPTWKGWLWAGLIPLCAWGHTLFHHQLLWQGMRLGYQWRIETIAAVQGKTLRLTNSTITSTSSKSTKATTTSGNLTGKIVNMVSNDVRRFDEAGIFWVFIIYAPLELSLVYILLGLKLGWLSALAGVSITVLLIPTQFLVAIKIRKYRDKTASCTDDRVRVTSEAVHGILATKMSRWEKVLAGVVEEYRRNEMKWIQRFAAIKGCNMALSASVTALSALLLFGVAYAQGEELTLPKVFYALALLALPRLYFDFFFLGVSAVSEMMVCVRRIGVFLALEEPPPPWHALKEHQPDDDDVDVSIEKCDFFWSKVLKQEEQPTLQDITFKAHIGQLVAVVGSVGAGKSSLLAACLGEMIPSSLDTIKIRGPRVAYTSQSPWIVSGTVQDNILFGLPYDEDRYGRVVEGAALRADLATLPAEDQTELGERGINLSGGQKARVELARAAYSGAAVWLLDDPLSAVDPAVGKHIFEHLLLSTKNTSDSDEDNNNNTKAATKVLVTHQKQYLPQCDIIYVLREGRISHRGTYDELAALGIQEVVMTDRSKAIGGALTPTISAVFDTIEDEDDEDEDEEDKKDGTSHQQEEEALMINGTTTAAAPTSIKTKRNLDKLTSRYLRRFVSGQLNHQITTEEGTNVDDDVEEEKEGNLATDATNKATKAKLKAGKSGKLIVGEDRATGSVSWSLYYKYWSLMGLVYVIIICTALLGGHGVLIYSEYWLAQWASSDDQQDSKWLWVYGILAAIVVSMALLRSLLFFWRSLRASSILHNSMLSHVLGSPLSFFHTNPTGRILNRFTRDQGIGDEVLPQVTWDAVQSVTAVSGALLLLAVVIPVILPIFVPLLIVFVIIRRRYLYSSREIKRYEATTRSPVYASFSAILKGLPSIRAYGVQTVFKDQFLKELNENSSWWYCVISSARWIGFRLDTIVAILLTAAPLLIMALRDDVSAKLAGLALTQSLGLAGLLQWAVRQTAEVENNMTSIERMFEYGELDQEEDEGIVVGGERKHGNTISTINTATNATIQDSSIEYKQVTAVYRPGLPAVLKSITFTIPSGSRVGIAGRTGGGKSSLLLTLLRLIPITQGTILLGGVNITSVPLDVLRTLIFIIPQVPTLFSGSLRSNLDPYSRYDDAALWEVLHKVKLADKIGKIGGLGAHISDAGDNLSSGQKQLLVLARSLLQDSTRILAMDEATSNIDKNTDQAIQGVIRETIGRKTLLVIAHRIDTILDSNFIMVLNRGQLAECGEPLELLQRQNGAFSRIVRAAQRKGGLIS